MAAGDGAVSVAPAIRGTNFHGWKRSRPGRQSLFRWRTRPHSKAGEDKKAAVSRHGTSVETSTGVRDANHRSRCFEIEEAPGGALMPCRPTAPRAFDFVSVVLSGSGPLTLHQICRGVARSRWKTHPLEWKLAHPHMPSAHELRHRQRSCASFLIYPHLHISVDSLATGTLPIAYHENIWACSCGFSRGGVTPASAKISISALCPRCSHSRIAVGPDMSDANHSAGVPFVSGLGLGLETRGGYSGSSSPEGTSHNLRP